LGIVTRVGRPIVVLAVVMLAACTPIYTWDTNTTSTARAPSFDVRDLAREPVATIGVVAPGGLAGYSVALSHALIDALEHASPPLRGIPAHEIANAINDQGLVTEYGELLAGFTRSGIMDRERLQRIGSTLGFRYLLVPGLAEFNHVVLDRFEIAGVKVIRLRLTVLRVWLQLWDTRTGHVLWESFGEVGTASDVVKHDRIVPIDEYARKIWFRMIQRDLLEGGTGARSFFED
jgi:hypothetical protein